MVFTKLSVIWYKTISWRAPSRDQTLYTNILVLVTMLVVFFTQKIELNDKSPQILNIFLSIFTNFDTAGV